VKKAVSRAKDKAKIEVSTEFRTESKKGRNYLL
jgi:hypothetical protein